MAALKAPVFQQAPAHAACVLQEPTLQLKVLLPH